jgi:hypothetical protein
VCISRLASVKGPKNRLTEVTTEFNYNCYTVYNSIILLLKFEH